MFTTKALFESHKCLEQKLLICLVSQAKPLSRFSIPVSYLIVFIVQLGLKVIKINKLTPKM